MSAVHQVVGGDQIRSALQGILASGNFSRSQQLSRLLRYLCNCLIENGADRIAEYTIGTEVLGRPSDFDPTQDAAVRVEMHRLRRRLRDYYEGEGARDTVRIVIPAGRYAPVITWVGDEPKEVPSVPPPSETAAVAAAPTPGLSRGSFSSAIREHLLLLASLGLGALALVVLGLFFWRHPTSSASAHDDVGRTAADSRSDGAKTAAAVPLPASRIGYRIGCGRSRPWTDRLGEVWSRDEYFEGGAAVEIPPRSYVPGAFDAHLFESGRSGTFSYQVPLPAATYELRLYFIEPTFGPDTDAGGEGNRLFDVVVNGQKLLDRFDIITDADGAWIGDVRVFKDIVPGADGFAHVDFHSISSAALVNAIEFIPSRPHILNPVRILPQDNFYTDSAGNLWTPDNYSRGGRMSVHPGPVRNTSDQEIFRHERFGRFKYAIPVDRGNYSLYVYMSEEYWGPGNPGGGSAGARVFDIFCNGVALARGVDLLKEGGPNYGVVRAFHHLTPNAQGKLAISFEPVHDFASVYALEVIDEAGPDASSSLRIMK